jgi:hypothetical protein
VARFVTPVCRTPYDAGFAQGRLKQLHYGYKLWEAMLGRIKPLSRSWFQVGAARPSPGVACIPFRGHKNPLHFRLKRSSSLLAMFRTNKIPVLVIHLRETEGFIFLNSPLVEIAVTLQAVKPDAVAMRQGAPPVRRNDCLFPYSVRNRTVAGQSTIVNTCMFRFQQ